MVAYRPRCRGTTLQGRQYASPFSGAPSVVRLCEVWRQQRKHHMAEHGESQAENNSSRLQVKRNASGRFKNNRLGR